MVQKFGNDVTECKVIGGKIKLADKDERSIAYINIRHRVVRISKNMASKVSAKLL